MKKKILCLVLAIAMMLSLSAMVGAVEYDAETNTYTDESTITIKKTYTLTNAGTTSPAETFSFTIKAYSVEDSVEGVTVSNIPVPTIGTAEYKAGEATTDGATVSVTITLPGLASESNPAVVTDGVYNVYPGVGVYTYTIKEDAGGTAGVTYDESTLYLVVTVIEQDGQLRVATVHAENETSASGKTDTFDDNVYSAGSLSVSKTVTGNLGDKTKYFAVTVKLTGEGGMTYADSYAVSGGSYESNPPSVEVKAGEETEYTFYLKDDETITISNLPYGVTYTITESTEAAENNGYDAPAYSTDSTETDTYTLVQGTKETKDDTTTVTAGSVSGEIDDASDAVTITNNKSGDVDTGVILESMPYVMILAVVVVGGIALISKRKVSE